MLLARDSSSPMSTLDLLREFLFPPGGLSRSDKTIHSKGRWGLESRDPYGRRWTHRWVQLETQCSSWWLCQGCYRLLCPGCSWFGRKPPRQPLFVGTVTGVLGGPGQSTSWQSSRGLQWSRCRRGRRRCQRSARRGVRKEVEELRWYGLEFLETLLSLSL